ncbi:DUF6123 family protein [Peribacillus frigoritolerans]|uniref:DUF6123 family protein n=1 Tax=Peribacillus frigoritolerans TaxID=450367 RepID=UPI0010597153|nr:DUF6123 family protein [Peribacillus frigoritolerans]TDL82652.1 hypothetical protein E2R53_03520 [Peribacillus frigoritolerans]
MLHTKQSVTDYLLHLKDKGFQLKEDALGFISFGKHYTGAEDELVIAAIELTLKAQKEFDGSFFVSLLERLTKEKAKNRRQAILVAQKLNLI